MWNNRLSKGNTRGDRLALAIAYFQPTIMARVGLWASRCGTFNTCVEYGEAFMRGKLTVIKNCVKYGDVAIGPCVKIGPMIYDGEFLIHDHEIVNLRHMLVVGLEADEKYITLATALGPQMISLFADAVIYNAFGFIYLPYVDRIKYLFASESSNLPGVDIIKEIHTTIQEMIKTEVSRFLMSGRKIIFRDII